MWIAFLRTLCSRWGSGAGGQTDGHDGSGRIGSPSPYGRPGWWDLDLAKAREPSGLDITRTHLILLGSKTKAQPSPLPPSLGLRYYEVSTHGGAQPPSRASGQGSFWALADLSHCEMWEMSPGLLQAGSVTDGGRRTTTPTMYIELVGRSY
jgi:hypothetical protein